MTNKNITPFTHPAYFLDGVDLTDGWTVVNRGSSARAASGHFSVGYDVENEDGRKGFLKALDLSGALNAPNVMLELQKLGDHYTFEVNLLELCRRRRMNRIVVAIAHGEHRRDDTIIPVPYIIFDRADGDVRTRLSSQGFDLAWVLRCLHHVTTALKQLHTSRHAHNAKRAQGHLRSRVAR